jgi:hypothetical protein
MTAEGDGRQWSWWAGEMVKLAMGPQAGHWAEPETYTVNEMSRETVIAQARGEFGAEARIMIVHATQDGPFETDLFDGDSPLIEQILERFAEVNDHRFGEDGYQGDLDGDELAAALNVAFGTFVAEREAGIVTWSFTALREKQIVEPLLTVANDG